MFYRLSSFDSNFLFLYFQLVFPALIVLFHTVGVFPSPIVIFSFLLCGLPSFDSNLLSELCRFIPFRFFAFCFFAFCLFAFSLLLSCAYQKTISMQVSRKLADKTKDEIMTAVLPIGFSPALTSRLSRLRTRSFVSPSPLRSTFGRPTRFRETASFRFAVLCLGGRPPY